MPAGSPPPEQQHLLGVHDDIPLTCSQQSLDRRAGQVITGGSPRVHNHPLHITGGECVFDAGGRVIPASEGIGKFVRLQAVGEVTREVGAGGHRVTISDE